MVTQQGSLDLLDDPVAQQLLNSGLPGSLSYVWTDGTPRVVPIGMYWTGSEFFIGTNPDSPKMDALETGARVALSIATDTFPYKVLLVRGPVRVDTYPGIAPEYEEMSKLLLGPEGSAAWLANMRPMTPEMATLYVSPEWVGILDFERRFPSAVERAMERAQAQV